MNSAFIHSQACVEDGAQIGDDTRIWQYTVVLPNAKIGADCNVCTQCLIENDVIVGDRVTIKSGVQLWDGVRIGNDVFIGPNATFTNDLRPRSKAHPDSFLPTTLEDGCSIGANATLLPGIKIGAKAIVGAGAVVTHDVPANAIVIGNPASIAGYVDTPTAPKTYSSSSTSELQEIAVKGVHFHELTYVPDLRGKLYAGQVGSGIPFESKRIFFITDVPNSKVS